MASCRHRASERRCSAYRGRIARLCRVRSWTNSLEDHTPTNRGSPTLSFEAEEPSIRGRIVGLISLRFCDSSRNPTRAMGLKPSSPTSIQQMRPRLTWTVWLEPGSRPVSNNEPGWRPCPQKPNFSRPGPRPETAHSIPGEAGRDHHVISECSRLKAPLPSPQACCNRGQRPMEKHAQLPCRSLGYRGDRRRKNSTLGFRERMQRPRRGNETWLMGATEPASQP